MLTQLQSELANGLGIKEAVVMADLDAQMLFAYVRPDAGYANDESVIDAVKAHAAEKLPQHMQPVA